MLPSAVPTTVSSEGYRIPLGALSTQLRIVLEVKSFEYRITKGRILTSVKKIEDNPRNALKSTEPKTPEGKAAAWLNVSTHVLLSREVLLPGEDEQALKELNENLLAELQPVGELEDVLVDRIVAAHWKLRRLGRVEAKILLGAHLRRLAERAQEEARTYESSSLEGFAENQYGPSTE